MGNRTAVKIYNNAHNLDTIITKNQNKLEIYIYIIMIPLYVIKLIKIAKGEKILYMLRYIKAVMCEKLNYKYWFKKLILAG